MNNLLCGHTFFQNQLLTLSTFSTPGIKHPEVCAVITLKKTPPHSIETFGENLCFNVLVYHCSKAINPLFGLLNEFEYKAPCT